MERKVQRPLSHGIALTLTFLAVSLPPSAGGPRSVGAAGTRDEQKRRHDNLSDVASRDPGHDGAWPSNRSGPTSLPNTTPLDNISDRSEAMAAGIARYFEAQTALARETRFRHWKTDTFSPNAKRERLAKIVGAVDARVPPQMERVAQVGDPAFVAETERFTAQAVRWPVFDGVHGEGLLLEPRSPARARVIVLPDADQTPELLAGLAPGLPVSRQFARRLAENGVQVLILTLADRSAAFSYSDTAGRSTNLPHREWIYRPAYELGRHIIGYELQKIRSGVDWLSRQSSETSARIGVAGWGEGGLLALYAAALDTRIDCALVSGYFSKREALWSEPIYRNVFGLLRDFGDAEIASLIAPRALIVEHSVVPRVSGPPQPKQGQRNTAAPGALSTPAADDVREEWDRALALAGREASARFRLYGNPSIAPLGEQAAALFLESLSVEGPAPSGPRGRATNNNAGTTPHSTSHPAISATTERGPPIIPDLRPGFDPATRQQRVVREMERHTQRLLLRASDHRQAAFWSKTKPTTPEAWREAMLPFRETLWTDVLGRLDGPTLPPNPRARFLRETPAWTAYEVTLDVMPHIFAWGFLLVPKDIQPGERRPVVVAQHGLNSTHEDVIDTDPASKFYHQFKGFGARLADRGFIVFAPRNPYLGSDLFRSLQRRANPLGKSIFSVILAQHDRILDWLTAQPFVDPARIGFYGLSYGGKTAMRVPALLDRYALSVCSGDFNEWIWKNATTESDRSYLFTNEYEMPEFDLGMTFSYAEMAAMIAPRPFMVERGHDDTVAIDEWVAFEYAKVNRLYARLSVSDRTEIEYFIGPHTIHGVGTFRFLHRHLNWPARR